MRPVPDPSEPGLEPRVFGRVCVFCGSSAGRGAGYLAAATEVGTHLAEEGIGVVYGGGSAGLMGALATAALDAGGDVVGVLPTGLFPDGVTASPLRTHHRGTLRIEEVPDMHTRKARFHELADAYIVLPGGLGTLEEAAEVATWSQIGLHDSPMGFLDVGGYFDPLMSWLDRSVEEGFLRASTRSQIHVERDVPTLLARMQATVPEQEPKWIEP